MAMNIIEFLESRIAEDEAIARAAATCGTLSAEEWIASGVMVEFATECAQPAANANNALLGFGTARALHIACHDPARVLRECENKRTMLAQYQTLIDGPDWMTDAMVHAWGTMLRQAAIEPMAAIYCDHPDYQPDWTRPVVAYADNFDRADGALGEKLGARWTPSRSSGVAIATNVADNAAQAPNALRVETLQLGDVTFELPPYVALQPGDLVTWAPAGENVNVKVTRADAEIYDYFGPAIRRASAEVQAFDRHVGEHGCGDPKNPNFNRGIWHCPEGRRLWDAIDRDDPDFPVPMA